MDGHIGEEQDTKDGRAHGALATDKYVFFLFALSVFCTVVVLCVHADPRKKPVTLGHSYDQHNVLEIVKLEDGLPTDIHQ